MENNIKHLEPCPLCKGEIEHHTWSGFHHGDRGYSPKVESFTCKKCGLKLNVRGDDITKEQAIEQWNIRPAAVASGDRQKTLDEMPQRASEVVSKDHGKEYRQNLAFWFNTHYDMIKSALTAPNTEIFGVLQERIYRHDLICLASTEQEAEALFWQLYNDHIKNPRQSYHQTFDGHHDYVLFSAPIGKVLPLMDEDAEAIEDIVTVIKFIEYAPLTGQRKR